jgi:aldehyde dehydrogenase (NAD+)
VPRGGSADVDRAVRAAEGAMRGPWARLAPAERGALLFKLADEIAAHRQELARLETLDVGKPLKESISDMDGVVATLRYNAGAADKMEGETIPLGHDGFPTGVVNVVSGFGEEAGDALVRHPLVRGVSFTGSVETGRKILGAAAPGIKPAVLELGGKNPMIVFADADLDRAVGDALAGPFENCGQVCSSSSRYLLHPAIREDFLGMLTAKARALTIGPGIDDPDLGPIVSREQYDRVTGYVARASAEGARLRTGGKRPRHLQRGYFIEPTIFEGVDPASAIAREEVFGPVGVAIDVESEEKAVAIANGLGYGLAAGIYTRDILRALRLARRIEAGSVWINGWWMGGVQAPTGGMKESGIGRERGLAGIRNYLQVKNVAIRL